MKTGNPIERLSQTWLVGAVRAVAELVIQLLPGELLRSVLAFDHTGLVIILVFNPRTHASKAVPLSASEPKKMRNATDEKGGRVDHPHLQLSEKDPTLRRYAQGILEGHRSSSRSQDPDQKEGSDQKGDPAAVCLHRSLLARRRPVSGGSDKA